MTDLAALLRRNVLIHDGEDATRFRGEWVAVPREDFNAARAALAARGVTVAPALDVERLARAMQAAMHDCNEDSHDPEGEAEFYAANAAAIARAYGSAPAVEEEHEHEWRTFGFGPTHCATCGRESGTPAPDARLRAAAQAVVEHFADGDGHDVAYRDGEWVCTDDCRAHALLAALRAALGDEHD